MLREQCSKASIGASPQDGPHWVPPLVPLVLTPFFSPLLLPYCTRIDLCGQWNMTEWMTWLLLKLSCKELQLPSWPLYLLGHLIWENVAIMSWGHSGCLWWGPHGEEFESLAKSQWRADTCQQLHEWAWKQIHQPQWRLKMPAALATSLTSTSWGPWTRPTQLSCSWIPECCSCVG